MPFKSIKSLPVSVKNALPVTAQKLFLEVFNVASSTYDEERSFDIAWNIIQNKFTKKEGNWIAKSNPVKPYMIKGKSMFGENLSYFGEFIFGDINIDTDGDAIPQSTFLNKINGMKGDIEHCNLYDKEGFDRQDLFEVIESFYIGDKFVGKVKFNIEHKEFPIVWEEVKKGEFGISMEYKKVDNDWEIIGITGTKDPKNQRSKLLHAYTN